MKSTYNFYKLFGYDIMLDSDREPKLIEINARPAALNDKETIKSILNFLLILHFTKFVCAE